MKGNTVVRNTTAEQARPRWRGAARWVAVLAATVIALHFLRGRMPSWSSIEGAWRQARPGWMVVAALTEALSLSLFARQQRWLFGAFGVRMSRRHMLAVTYSRSAMSMALPAGSVVSAGFAIEEFHRRGAERATSVTVMVLSGVASLAGLVSLYGVGAAGLGLVHAAATHPARTAALALVAAVLAGSAFVFVRGRLRARAGGPGRRGPVVPVSENATWQNRARAWVRDQVTAMAELSPKHWAGAVGLAMANWCTDLVCLIAVAHAFDLHVDAVTIAAVYLAVQLVRQIPLSPGGIGLIETSLMAGLLLNGADNAAAAGVVLGYRVLSCWLIIPIGMASWLWLSRTAERSLVVEPLAAANLAAEPVSVP
jgi:uncharacterized protein (TIRG00374 family)